MIALAITYDILISINYKEVINNLIYRVVQRIIINFEIR